MISIPPDDALTALVFALGLTFGFVRREDVVRWADRRIMEIDSPPVWLIELSLSRDWNPLDVISKLEEVGKSTDPDAVFKAILGLVPEVRGMSFEAAEAMAKRIYDIARHCIDDWHNPLLREADQISPRDDAVDRDARRSGAGISNSRRFARRIQASAPDQCMARRQRARSLRP